VKSRPVTRLAWGAVLAIAVVALLADFFASDLPIACRVHGETFILPNVTHPEALRGRDCRSLARERWPGDWSLDPLIAVGPREGTALDGAPRVAPPWTSPGHPLGTDQDGRDVFARLVHGARTSLGTGLLAAIVFLAVGTVLGSLAGFYGGVIDAVVGRAIETLTPFPTLILVLVVQALLPHPTIESMLLAIGLTRWTEVARIVRAEVLLVMSQDYVLAARALGVRPLRVLFRHVAPNAAAPVLVAGAFGIAQVVLIESSLEYLHVGVTGSVSWGEMLSEARGHPGAYWLLVFPGLAIFVVVAAFNLVGEAWRDALDPRLAHASTRMGSLGAAVPPASD